MLKIEFFASVFPTFQEFREKEEPKYKLKYIFNHISHTTEPRKYQKHRKNFFLVQRYHHPHHLSLQLDLQIPTLDILSVMSRSFA